MIVGTISEPAMTVKFLKRESERKSSLKDYLANKL